MELLWPNLDAVNPLGSLEWQRKDSPPEVDSKPVLVRLIFLGLARWQASTSHLFYFLEKELETDISPEGLDWTSDRFSDFLLYFGQLISKVDNFFSWVWKGR